MLDRFYVYEHWRPDTNNCFYVGKGTRRRARKMTQRDIQHERIQNKLARQGMTVEVRLVAEGLCEAVAFRIERERIEFWRSAGTSLVNRVDGGGGVANPDAEVRAKMSRSSKRKWNDPEFCERWHVAFAAGLKKHRVAERCAAKMRGRKLTQAHKDKISAGLHAAYQVSTLREEKSARMRGEGNPFFGRKHLPEVADRIAAKKRGSRLSQETREKMRAAQQARRQREIASKPPEMPKAERRSHKLSPETIERLRLLARARGMSRAVIEAAREANGGRRRAPFSEETKRKMSAAAASREECRRQLRGAV